MQQLSRSAFEAWRNDPVTRMVVAAHKRLEDYIRQSWAAGGDWTEEARYVVRHCKELQELNFRQIALIYDADENTEMVLIDETPLGLYPDEEDDPEEE